MTPPTEQSPDQKLGEWFRYLEATGNLDSYESTCDCWKCKEIKAGFAGWKKKVAVDRIAASNFTGVIKGRRVELIMDTTDEAQELFNALVTLRTPSPNPTPLSCVSPNNNKDRCVS